MMNLLESLESLEKENSMENVYLHDWIFHFNIYTSLWEATTRDFYTEIFSGGNNVIRSSSINTLVCTITRWEGDLDKVKEFIEKIPL